MKALKLIGIAALTLSMSACVLSSPNNDRGYNRNHNNNHHHHNNNGRDVDPGYSRQPDRGNDRIDPGYNNNNGGRIDPGYNNSNSRPLRPGETIYSNGSHQDPGFSR